MTFQINALKNQSFEPLFDLTDDELDKRGAVRVTADAPTGFPCRVSLEDANVGDELILTNYKHLDMDSPFVAIHAIYIRQDAKEADVVEGEHLSDRLESMFSNPAIAFIDIHAAKQGCFTARAQRA